MDLQVKGLAATRQTWRGKTVRELLAEVIADNRNADENILRREFRARLRDDEEFFLAVADYAFDAAFRALTEQKQRHAPTAEQRAATAAASAGRAAEHARVVKGLTEQILMLNLEMPNGKRMRYCTGSEMSTFGRAYEKIGRRVGKTKRVGEVLDEKQVRELMS
jgi:hypothetical protein